MIKLQSYYFEIYADSAFGCLNTINYLSEIEIETTTPNRVDSKNVWKYLDSKIEKKGDHEEIFYSDLKNPPIVAVSWQDKSRTPTNFLSNVHGTYNEKKEMASTKKGKIIPQVVKYYNLYMNGVDKVDSNTKRFKPKMRNIKGTCCRLKSMIYYMLHNARIAFCIDHEIPFKQLPMRSFLEKVIEQVTKVPFSSSALILQNNKSQQQHLPEYVEKKKSCRLCFDNGKLSLTNWFCSVCGDGFCLNKKRNCFFCFHSQLQKINIQDPSDQESEENSENENDFSDGEVSEEENEKE